MLSVESLMMMHPVGMPHGDGDDDLFAEVEDVLARVQHDAEWVQELMCRKTQGLMPMI